MSTSNTLDFTLVKHPFMQQSIQHSLKNKYPIVPWTMLSITDDISSYKIKSPSNVIPKALKNDKKAANSLMIKRKSVKYGGSNVDPKHLGGYLMNDSDTYERELWDWIFDTFDIHSIIDVGCGIGCSTLYFQNHPRITDALCIEGSIDAYENSLVKNITVRHDYTLGAYWTAKEFDMVWSAEFLEHVSEEYMDNYMSTFKKAKLLFVTHSEWGGWHHINVHKSEWWILQFEKYGFQFSEYITNKAREKCPLLGKEFKYSYHDLHTDGNRRNSHFHFRGLVFFNKLYFNELTSYDRAILQAHYTQE